MYRKWRFKISELFAVTLMMYVIMQLGMLARWSVQNFVFLYCSLFMGGKEKEKENAIKQMVFKWIEKVQFAI
jgi:hypothetical protein